MPLTIFFLSRHHVRKEFQLSLSKQFKGYPYIRCVFEMKCEFFREHRKRKDGKKIFYKDFSINMSPILIHFQWRSYSFWSALVKSSLMMVGTTPFNLVSLLYLILPAKGVQLKLPRGGKKYTVVRARSAREIFSPPWAIFPPPGHDFRPLWS